MSCPRMAIYICRLWDVDYGRTMHNLADNLGQPHNVCVIRERMWFRGEEGGRGGEGEGEGDLICVSGDFPTCHWLVSNLVQAHADFR